MFDVNVRVKTLANIQIMVALLITKLACDCMYVKNGRLMRLVGFFLKDRSYIE